VLARSLVALAFLVSTARADTLGYLRVTPFAGEYVVDKPKTAARVVVARTAAEWRAAWTQTGGTGPAAPVDFDRHMIVGVVNGPKDDRVIYRIQLDDAANPNTLEVHLGFGDAPTWSGRTRKKTGAHFVVTPRSGLTVRFVMDAMVDGGMFAHTNTGGPAARARGARRGRDAERGRQEEAPRRSAGRSAQAHPARLDQARRHARDRSLVDRVRRPRVRGERRDRRGHAQVARRGTIWHSRSSGSFVPSTTMRAGPTRTSSGPNSGTSATTSAHTPAGDAYHVAAIPRPHAQVAAPLARRLREHVEPVLDRLDPERGGVRDLDDLVERGRANRAERA
jgi:hypothetical protein